MEISNEEKAHKICETIMSIYGVDIAQETHCYSAALAAMQWKDKQHKQEKQQWIEEACERLEEYFAPDGSMVPENIRLWRDLQRVIKGE